MVLPVTLMPIFRNIRKQSTVWPIYFYGSFRKFHSKLGGAWYHFDVWNVTGGWIYNSIPNKHVLYYVYILEISLSWISSPLCFFFRRYYGAQYSSYIQTILTNLTKLFHIEEKKFWENAAFYSGANEWIKILA